MRDWLVRKKIYPSHSGNFCDSVISGIVASNDSTKRGEKKRERERPKKKYMSVPHYDRRAYS